VSGDTCHVGSDSKPTQSRHKDAPPGAQVMRMVEVAMVQHVSGALATEGGRKLGHLAEVEDLSSSQRRGGAGHRWTCTHARCCTWADEQAMRIPT